MDDQRLPSGDGSGGLSVRDDGTILGFARPKSDGPVVLRGISPDGTQAEDLAELDVPSSPGGAGLTAHWDLAHAQQQVLTNIISGLIYVVMGLLLALQMVMRLALVDLLLVVAPLALLCWALPQTQGWARLWSALFTGTVFVQSLQVLGLKLGVSLAAELPDIAGGTTAELVRTFLGIGILALVLKLPRFMPGPSGGAGGIVTVLETIAIGRSFGLGGGGARGGAARGSRLHITVQASEAEHRLATTAPSEVAALGAEPARSNGAGRRGWAA
jgi:hypothetical protein